MKKKLVYTEYSDEIGQWNAYFGKILFNDTVYAIPFVNLDLSNEHPLSLNKKNENCVTYLDIAYLFFVNYELIEREDAYSNGQDNKQQIFGKYKLKNKDIFLLGAKDFETYTSGNKPKLYSQWKIICEVSFLQLLENSKISNNLFLPVDTTNQKANMNLKEVRNFVTNKYLPENLRKLIQ